jgi:hypothetical protein
MTLFTALCFGWLALVACSLVIFCVGAAIVGQWVPGAILAVILTIIPIVVALVHLDEHW